MRARSFGAGLFASLGVVACGSHAAHRPLATSPVARPETVMLEVAHGGGDGALAALRDALPDGAMRSAAPQHLADIVLVACLGLPSSVAARVRPSSPMRVVALRAGGLRSPAVAVRVALQAGDAPLGGGVTLDPEDADGVREIHVTSPPAGAPAAVAALRGDVLVCAGDRETLRAALPYLARTLVPSPAPAGLSFLEPPGHPATDLRWWLDEAAGRAASGLRDSARTALAAHAQAPALGDPVAVVDTLLETARAVIAYLGDLTELSGALRAGPEGLHLTTHAPLQTGSPLATMLSHVPTFSRGLAGALPTGTAVGIVVGDAHRPDRRARSGGILVNGVAVGPEPLWPFADELVADAQRIAGPRFDEAARAALANLLTAFEMSRGDATLVSLGHDGHAPFLLVGVHGATEPPAAATIAAAARAPFLATIASALGGCAPDAGPAQQQGAAVDLCGERAAWQVAQGSSGWAGVLGPVSSDLGAPPGVGSSPTQAARVASALAGGAVDTLGAHPDDARAIATLPASPLLVVAFSARTLAPALDLFASERTTRSVETASPVFLSLTRTDGELTLDVVAPRHSVAPLVAATVAALGD